MYRQLLKYTVETYYVSTNTRIPTVPIVTCIVHYIKQGIQFPAFKSCNRDTDCVGTVRSNLSGLGTVRPDSLFVHVRLIDPRTSFWICHYSAN